MNVTPFTKINTTDPELSQLQDNIRAALEPILKLLASNTLGVPAGFMGFFPTTSAPTGFLLVDGSTQRIAVYPALFRLFGTLYGGDGRSTFALPPSPGRFILCSGQGSSLTLRKVGDQGGEETHLLTTTEMPSHGHALNDPGHYHNTTGSATYSSGGPVLTDTGGNSQQSAPYNKISSPNTTGITLSNTGGGGAHNNMPPYLVFALMVKT